MALRRLGTAAVRHAGAAGALRMAATPTPTPTLAAWPTPTTTLARPTAATASAASHQWSRHQHHHLNNYSTVTTAIAAASAAATVAKKIAAATAVAAKTAASARTATTGGAAAATMAKTLMQRAGGALFEAGASRGALSAAAAAGTAALSAAVVRGGGATNGAAPVIVSAASTAAKRREQLLRHAAAVDRAFRLSRGRLPGTPFRIWRGLPFARVAARAAHGTALVALAIGHGAPMLLTTRLMINLVAESCLRAVPLAGGPLAYLVFEKGMGTGGITSNIALLEKWAAKEEARERKLEARNNTLPRRLMGMFVPPWRRNVAPATARRRKGWGVWGTAKRGMMLAGAAGVLALVPAGVAFTAVTTAARWVLAAFFDSAGF